MEIISNKFAQLRKGVRTRHDTCSLVIQHQTAATEEEEKGEEEKEGEEEEVVVVTWKLD